MTRLNGEKRDQLSRSSTNLDQTCQLFRSLLNLLQTSRLTDLKQMLLSCIERIIDTKSNYQMPLELDDLIGKLKNKCTLKDFLKQFFEAQLKLSQNCWLNKMGTQYIDK